MGSLRLISIESDKKTKRRIRGKIMLVKPPYFTPWTPPLGIGILKSYVEQNGFSAKCFDFNIDSELWGMHHKYFAALQNLEDVWGSDGYSKLWWILNAHLLAYVNGGDAATCVRLLEYIVPLYGIRSDRKTIDTLIPLVERFFDRLSELIESIDWSEYSLVGTSTYTTSLASSLFILKMVKQKHPHLKTVMGGGVFADDLALGSENLDILIQEYPYVEHIILGEGELLLLKILEGDFHEKRVISIADLRGVTLGVENVPIPDFSDLDNTVYHHLSIEGARSCPFQCSFCSETVQWGEYRKKPVNLFVEQVMSLSQRYRNNTFFMGDSLMNPYINQFAAGLIERGANIFYDGYLRADKPVTNHKFVKLWAESGLFRVRLGIESASARVLETMNKKTTPSIISDVLKTLAKTGIRPTTYWIVGFPGETEQDFQETCNFIKDHHKYIYELEAHPYSYYPYGQVGSRLHQCYSLYPEEITKITKFKVWEVIGVKPDRKERYDRLRQISKLTVDLGLPNIYTMADRYRAEERWLRLYPLAIDVYGSAKSFGSEMQTLHHSVGVFSTEYWRQEIDGQSSARSVLCYCTLINKKLDESILSTSINHLIGHHEMLQLRLDNDKYVRDQNPVLPGDGILSVYDCNTECLEEIDKIRAGIIKELSASMRPEPGSSIRVVLLNKKEQSVELLLLIHKAIADASSAVLLLQDLYRIYEQLSNGKAVLLLPASKTYTSFLKKWELGNDSPLSGPLVKEPERKYENNKAEVSGKVRKLSVPMEKEVTARIFSRIIADYGLRPSEAILAALIRSFAKAEIDASITVMRDYRYVEPALEHTVGPLMTIQRLPAEILKDMPLASCLRQILQVLRCKVFSLVGEETVIASNSRFRESPKVGLPGINHLQGLLPGKRVRKPRKIVQTENCWVIANENSLSFGQVLFNLGYLIYDPSFDSDKWVPQGFLLDHNELTPGYSLEVSPVRSENGIQLHFCYEDQIEAQDFIDAILAHFASELNQLICHCEEFVAAREFWSNELYALTKLDTAIGIAEVRTAQDGWGTTHFQIAPSVYKELQEKFVEDLPILLLGAYSVLLSRLSGKQKLLILSEFNRPGESIVLPMKVPTSWEFSFMEFVQRVQQKFAQASQYVSHSLNILAESVERSASGVQSLCFEAGFSFQTHKEKTKTTISSEYLRNYSEAGQRLKLILEVNEGAGGLQLQFAHDRGHFSQDLIDQLVNHLISILNVVSKNVNTNLEDIRLSDQNKFHDSIPLLSSDSFNF